MLEQTLLQAGERVLTDNKFPDSEDLSLTVSNTGTGQNLILLGMSAKNTQSLRHTMDFMSMMENHLFTPTVVKTLNFDQKTALYREARKSAKFRHDFQQSVQEHVDLSKLHVDILTNTAEVKTSSTMSKDQKRVARERLTQTITRSWTLPSAKDVTQNVKIDTIQD